MQDEDAKRPTASMTARAPWCGVIYASGTVSAVEAVPPN